MFRSTLMLVSQSYCNLACLLILLTGLIACQAHSNQRSLTVALSNEDFKSVELNSDTQNACSPDTSGIEDFIGIAIQAPTEVEFDLDQPADDGSFVAIPICGFYQLDMADLLESSVIHLFAKNIETEQIYRGALLDEDPGTEEPLPFDEPELQAEDLRGQLLSAYFNPNLAQYLDLPHEEATYKVLVQVGKFKSNVVDIKVVKKP